MLLELFGPVILIVNEFHAPFPSVSKKMFRGKEREIIRVRVRKKREKIVKINQPGIKGDNRRYKQHVSAAKEILFGMSCVSADCRRWGRTIGAAGRPAGAGPLPTPASPLLPSFSPGRGANPIPLFSLLSLSYLYLFYFIIITDLFIWVFFCFVLSRFVSGFWMLMLNLRSASEMGISVSLYAQHGGCSFLAFRCTGRFSFSHFYLFVYLIGMVCFSGVFLEKKKW